MKHPKFFHQEQKVTNYLTSLNSICILLIVYNLSITIVKGNVKLLRILNMDIKNKYIS